MEQLNQIRAPQKSDSRKKQVLVTAVVLLLGICLGWFSKYLDERQAELPGLLAKLDELLDFHNFLGGFAPCALVAGFFPRSYALVWIAFTVASPVLAFFCWYAKGKGPVALLLSAAVSGVMLNTAFSYGMLYLDLRSWLNLVMLVIALWVLRKSPKQMLAMLGIAAAFAVLIKLTIPFEI